MKARLLRDMTAWPSAAFPVPWECSVCPAAGEGSLLTTCPGCQSPVRQGKAIQPKGTVLDGQDVFRLVQMGIAEAADDECRRRANRTPAQMVAASHAYTRTALGLHPEDFAAYEAQEMIGYNPDGSFIPGPAFTGGDEEVDEEEVDEQDHEN